MPDFCTGTMDGIVQIAVRSPQSQSLREGRGRLLHLSIMNIISIGWGRGIQCGARKRHTMDFYSLSLIHLAPFTIHPYSYVIQRSASGVSWHHLQRSAVLSIQSYRPNGVGFPASRSDRNNPSPSLHSTEVDVQSRAIIQANPGW